jgi:hypothetical protein
MVQIYALCCGYLEFDRHVFFPDRNPGTHMTIPVSSYLLIHPHGRVLFDTGVHCHAVADPVGRLGERRAKRFTVRSQVGDDVVSQLARQGCARRTSAVPCPTQDLPRRCGCIGSHSGTMED